MRSPKVRCTQNDTVAKVSYCVEEVAAALGIGRTYVYNLIKSGELNAVKIGRRRLIPVREVEAFMSRLSGVA